MDRGAAAEWCRRHFSMMNDGGTWGIPRSGVVFQRQGDELVLIDAMPWVEGMPITAEELAAQQEAEFVANQEAFGDAGITVRRG